MPTEQKLDFAAGSGPSSLWKTGSEPVLQCAGSFPGPFEEQRSVSSPQLTISARPSEGRPDDAGAPEPLSENHQFHVGIFQRNRPIPGIEPLGYRKPFDIFAYG